MPRLKCGVNSCIFFDNENCTRNSIVVGGRSALEHGDTCCDSYHQKGRDEKKDALYKMEIGSIGKINYHMNVSCSAVNCQFNKGEVCRAKEIKIGGSKAKTVKDTCCTSFEIK